MIRRSTLLLFAAALVAVAGAAAPPPPADAGVDPALPLYQPSQPAVRGSIVAVGSSTVGNLLSRWTDEFLSRQPDVSFSISGAGSATAPPALVSGAAQLAPMSRPMNDAEIASFRARYGYEPTPIVVAIDALAVFVNAANPIESLTLDQIDAIFAADPRRGGKAARTWGDLGLAGEWADRPIVVYGFRDTAGGYSLFREIVMQGGAFRADISVQPGSSAIVNGVGAFPNAIGFASQFFRTQRTRMVPIADASGVPQPPELAQCENGDYPLARELYIYINKAPGKPADPLIAEFLAFILSREGQTIALDDSNFPLSAAHAAEQRAKLSP